MAGVSGQGLQAKLVDVVGELAPVGGLEGHEADALEEVNGAAGWAEENVGAVLELGAFEDDGVATVLEGAAHQGAAAKLLSVDGYRLIFDSLVLDHFHRFPLPSGVHAASRANVRDATLNLW